jgi:hypothetical protein
LEELEALSIAADNEEYYSFAADICDDAAVKEFVQAEKQNSGGSKEPAPLWRMVLAIARVHDFQGRVTEVESAVKFLTDREQQDPTTPEKCAKQLQELQHLRATLAARKKLLEAAAVEATDPSSLAQSTVKLLQSNPTLSARRRNLQWVLKRLVKELPASERSERWRQGCVQALGAAEAAALWEGFPTQFRDRFLGDFSSQKLGPEPPPEKKPTPKPKA